MSDDDDEWGNVNYDSEDDDVDMTGPKLVKKSSLAVEVIAPDGMMNIVINKIDKWTATFGLSQNQMVTVARHYNWREDKLVNWLDDQKELNEKLGLEPNPMMKLDSKINISLPSINKDAVCLVCYEDLDEDNSFCLTCEHTFCKDCWVEHIKGNITVGINVCDAPCMQEGCNMKVGYQQFVDLLQDDQALRNRYWGNLSKSYAAEDKSLRWCCNKKCDYMFQVSMYSQIRFANCTNCGFETCLSCNKERHSPCTCHIVTRWATNWNGDDDQSEKWIKLFTKPCPKCKTPIEKNGGCLFMKCSQNNCKYEFCYYCMSGECLNHAFDKRKCTKFAEREKDTGFQNSEKEREKGIEEQKKLDFYVEKFASNERDAKHATGLWQSLQEVVDELHNKKNYPFGELTFLEQARALLVQCRITLKWTYAYAFFCVNEKTNENVQKKVLFEYMQTDLENYTQKLHEQVMIKKDKFLDPKIFEKTEFYHYRGTVLTLTEVILKYQGSVIEYIEADSNNI